jgi:perosamine synthetase
MFSSNGPRSPSNSHDFIRSLTTFSTVPGEEGMGRLIPRPDIPVQPVLSWSMFGASSAAAAPAVTDQGRTIFLTAARIAIVHALELSGIRPGQKVLVPAYHCIVMIEPIIQIGALPVFYRLREDLSVDIDDVAAKIDSETHALISISYFGFPQDLRTLRRFCDERGLTFIEDCAHSFFGSFGGRPLGSFGHFAVASLTKFFPVRDGGCLVISSDMSPALDVKLRSQSFSASGVSGFRAIEEAVVLGRLRALAPIVRLVEPLKRIIRAVRPGAPASQPENPARERSGQRGGVDLAWKGVKASALSRAICRHAGRTRIVERRRRNYERLVREFSGLRHCRPVFSDLPEGVVPFMFSLYVEHLSDIFSTLEDRAVPMQRFGQFLWSDLDEETCPVTAKHSRHAVQLACHQDLTDDEITAIVDRVRGLAA